MAGVAGLAALTLAACGGGGTAAPAAPTAGKAAPTTGAAAAPGKATAAPQPAAASGKAATVRFEMYSDKATADKWTDLAGQLLKQDPNLNVKVEFITGQDAYAKYETEMAGGTGPDIMEFETKRMASYAARKSLFDLSPLMAKSTSTKQEDFYSVDWGRSQWNGKSFLYPYESKPAVIYYNKALFDKKQVPYPKYNWADPKWTWDELLSVAQKLSGGSGAQQTFGYYHPTWWVYCEPYIWSNGG